MHGLLGRVKWLLERGAKAGTEKFAKGFTALMAASEEGHVEVIRALCARGANVNGLQHCTALVLACQKGLLKVVYELCERGADLNATLFDGDTTVLMVATWYEHLEVVRELTKRGARMG
jgi:ankyrin repeat protein